MMKKPRPSRLGLAATALVAALTLSSTANFASAINDYGGLRGNAIANSNGSTDIWGGEPGTDGNHFNHQKQRNLKKKNIQSTPSLTEEEETLVEQLDEEWKKEEEWEEGKREEEVEERDESLVEQLEEELSEVEWEQWEGNKGEDSLIEVEQLEEDWKEVEWEEEGDESLVEAEQLEEDWNKEEEWDEDEDEEEGEDSSVEQLGEELELEEVGEVGEVEEEEKVAEWEQLGEALEEVKQDEMAMAAQLNSVNYYCGCTSCTQDVLSQIAGGYSCAARINWVIRNKGMSSLSACKLVADEFPSICGRCHADRCGSVPTPTPGPGVRAGVMSARDISWLKEHNDRRSL